MPSCLLAFVPSCYRAFVLSCLHVIVLSCYHAFVLSCLRAIVPSCYRAFVPSCLRAIVPFGAYSSYFTFLNKNRIKTKDSDKKAAIIYSNLTCNDLINNADG
ncbi:MAG TPA: hypothetical protein DDY04_01080 [Bacteroidales bacterium]|nr:hypothetical protein [Bacteroidales bacterium]